MSSVFTKIINRELPAQIVYEDEQTIAFLDIRPVSRGHTLVVPKVEVDQFQDLDVDTYTTLMQTVHYVARIIKTKLQPQRVGVVIYGFDVPHVHVQLIPMDKPGLIQFQHGEEVAPEELADVRAELVGD